MTVSGMSVMMRKMTEEASRNEKVEVAVAGMQSDPDADQCTLSFETQVHATSLLACTIGSGLSGRLTSMMSSWHACI